ncbi:hypothetical protein [Thermococcus sp.]|uniref:hypothetical protein n=1 Tax=Thermococcus sp. TaxID=35749 RepID=UPI00260F6C86|nr:hypothetical protein [Thermococcus sp.]
MDLSTISTIIGSVASLLSAILMYYFTQYFPWETSRKNVMRILLEQSPEFKKIIESLKKTARRKLGSRDTKKGLYTGIGLSIIGTVIVGGICWFLQSCNDFVSNLIGYEPSVWDVVTFTLLVVPFTIWLLMLITTFLMYDRWDNHLYFISRVYIGSSLVFIASLGIVTAYLKFELIGGFLVFYVIVFGTIILLDWVSSKKEREIVKEEWPMILNEHKGILLRVYTQDGREFVGILQNVFDYTWLQLRRVDSRSTVNIEWRTIKGVEVIE